MSNLIVEGKLHSATEIENKGDFKIREFIIDTGGKYPQKIPFTLFNDRCEAIKGIKRGEEVRVYFDIRGKEYNERHYVSLIGWKVEKLDGFNTPIQEQPQPLEDTPF